MPLIRPCRRSRFVPATNRHEYNEIVYISPEHVTRGWMDGQGPSGVRVRVTLDGAVWRSYLRGVELEGQPAASWEEAVERLRGPLAAERKLLQVRS